MLIKSKVLIDKHMSRFNKFDTYFILHLGQQNMFSVLHARLKTQPHL